MIALLNSLQDRIDALPAVDFLAPLALRLYLASVFWVAGMNKVADFENTVAWFANPDWGLGLPLPTLMAALAPHGDRQRGFPDSDCERFRRDAFALDFVVLNNGIEFAALPRHAARAVRPRRRALSDWMTGLPGAGAARRPAAGVPGFRLRTVQTGCLCVRLQADARGRRGSGCWIDKEPRTCRNSQL
jgi:hypothetical protein